MSIKIDNKEWMLANLDVSRFRNGDPIPEARTEAEWKLAGENGTSAFCTYDNDPANGKAYGKLYNWFAVTDPRGLAPEGWHVASDNEWRELADFLGGSDACGILLKSTTGWEEDGNGSNTSGFTALPGGSRDAEGRFSQLRRVGFWWTSTAWDDQRAWYRCIDRAPWYVYRTFYYKAIGLPVRCIKDAGAGRTAPSEPND
jgi:uncharacterized protein (TIGR02145 family)